MEQDIKTASIERERERERERKKLKQWSLLKRSWIRAQKGIIASQIANQDRKMKMKVDIKTLWRSNYEKKVPTYKWERKIRSNESEREKHESCFTG